MNDKKVVNEINTSLAELQKLHFIQDITRFSIKYSFYKEVTLIFLSILFCSNVDFIPNRIALLYL